MRKARLGSPSSARRGYLTPPVIIALALITLFVAATLFLHKFLISDVKKEPAPNPSPSAQALTTIDETVNTDEGSVYSDIGTANWKTYSNTEFGFSIRYPDSWKIEETNPSLNQIVVKIRSSDYKVPQNPYDGDVGKGSDFSISTNNTGYKSEYNNFLNIPDFDKKPAGEITVDGVKGFKGEVLTSLDGSNGIYIFIPFIKDDAKSITISYATFEKKIPDVLDQILSTFQFIN